LKLLRREGRSRAWNRRRGKFLEDDGKDKGQQAPPMLRGYVSVYPTPHFIQRTLYARPSAIRRSSTRRCHFLWNRLHQGFRIHLVFMRRRLVLCRTETLICTGLWAARTLSNNGTTVLFRAKRKSRAHTGAFWACAMFDNTPKLVTHPDLATIPE
jgi:hypothetical protein